MEPPPLPAKKSNPNQQYSIAVAVYAGLCFMGIVSLTGFMDRPGMDAHGRWAIGLARNMNVCILLLCVAILLVRKTLPAQKKWLTQVFNVLLLLSFPIGTAIAIYGLLKVDKNADSN